VDFDLCRRLVDEHPDNLWQSRKWAIDLHESFATLWDALIERGDLPEIIMGFNEGDITRHITLNIGKPDGTDHTLTTDELAAIAPLFDHIEELMQHRTNHDLITEFHHQLALSLEVWGSADNSKWFGVFRETTTGFKMEEMLGPAHPHWLACCEHLKISQETQPLSARPTSSARRM
jgi:hypothetical protein